MTGLGGNGVYTDIASPTGSRPRTGLLAPPSPPAEYTISMDALTFSCYFGVGQLTSDTAPVHREMGRELATERVDPAALVDGRPLAEPESILCASGRRRVMFTARSGLRIGCDSPTDQRDRKPHSLVSEMLGVHSIVP